MVGRDESLSDREISDSPFTCIYVWYERIIINHRKSSTLREVMSLLAIENPDLIPRSVSMSVKSVFVRPSSGKLAHKDLGMVFNFKSSKEEQKTLGELGLNIGDSLWVNTVKGYPQKSIIGTSKPVGSSRSLPRAQVLNKTVQSKDFGIVNRSRTAPYERSGQDRMEFRSNRTRAYDREYRSRDERSERVYNDKRHPDRMHPDRMKLKEGKQERNDPRDKNEADSKMDNDDSQTIQTPKESQEKDQGDGW